MARKRVTQLFPFLLPLRQKQRKFCFYLKMNFDGSRYAKTLESKPLPYEFFRTESLLINENSGYDIKFQINKVHNLKLAAATIDGLVIRPGETFSFWQLVRHGDDKEPYKDGLNLINGKIEGSYGGGLCQLSTMLFWMFLHTPLTIAERHGHAKEDFPPTTASLPAGTDATVSEGWLDLKVKNDTTAIFQIKIDFDDKYMYGRILSAEDLPYEYEVFNGNRAYYKVGDKTIEEVSVDCNRCDKRTGVKTHIFLYNNRCEIGYELPTEEEGV